MTTRTKNYKDAPRADAPKPAPRRTRRIPWFNIAAWTLMILLIVALLPTALDVTIGPLWRVPLGLMDAPNVTTPATLPTAAVLQPPIDKGSQQRPNVAPAPIDAAPAAAPLAPVVKVDQERANVAPVVAAPVVSESDKAHQAAPGTAERVQAVESTPEAQKGAQGLVKEDSTVKGGRGK